MEGWFIDNLNLSTPVTITVIFACLNIWIAWLNYQCSEKQKEIQNDSFCYQLFDKRLKVYYSIQDCLRKSIFSTDEINTLYQEFLQKTHDVPFLFGKDIQDKCNEIYNIILKLRLIRQKQNSLYTPIGEEYHRLYEEETELLKKIMDNIQDLPKIFQPYISFAKYQISPEDIIKTNERINLLTYPSILSIPPVS